MLKIWNLSLIILTFALTLFGTFLTRSGVISSVHAFSNSSLGSFFLVFIGITLIGALSVLVYRAHLLKSQGDIEGVVSRESAFLLNNLLLVAFTFTVLLGTIFPIFAEAIRGVKVSVGAPFFNQVSIPINLLLLLLMGIGPMVAWRRASLDNLRRNFFWPALFAMAVSVIALLWGVRGVYPLLAFGLSAFVLATIVSEFFRGTRVRMRHSGEALPTAFATLIERNNRRYGGFIVHLGVAIIAIAITASSAFKSEKEVTLNRGEAMIIGDYLVRFMHLEGYQEPHRFVVRATLLAQKEGQTVGHLQPRMNFYQNQREPIGSPSIHYNLKEDLYLILGAFDQQGQWVTIKALVTPLITWLWIGGGIITCGALIAAWPTSKKREQRLPKREESLVEVG
jgi:cytochrome c-type biogenesis protein CcmF